MRVFTFLTSQVGTPLGEASNSTRQEKDEKRVETLKAPVIMGLSAAKR